MDELSLTTMCHLRVCDNYLHDYIPPTTAITGYGIPSERLASYLTVFHWCSMAASNHTQNSISGHVPLVIADNVYAGTNKAKIVRIDTGQFLSYQEQTPDVYVRAVVPQRCGKKKLEMLRLFW